MRDWETRFVGSTHVGPTGYFPLTVNAALCVSEDYSNVLWLLHMGKEQDFNVTHSHSPYKHINNTAYMTDWCMWVCRLYVTFTGHTQGQRHMCTCTLCSTLLSTSNSVQCTYSRHKCCLWGVYGVYILLPKCINDYKILDVMHLQACILMNAWDLQVIRDENMVNESSTRLQFVRS